MGFWQGVYQGYQNVKAREEVEKERAERRAMVEEERAIRRAERTEDFQRNMALRQQEILLPLYVEQENSRRAAGALTAKAERALARFEGVDDPRVDALRKNPAAAAQLEDLITEREKDLAKDGINPEDVIPRSGAALLDLAIISAPETGEARVVDFSLDDLLAGGPMEPDAFVRTVADLSPRPQGSVELAPSAYFRPDAKRLEEGRNLFNQEILRLANDRINTLEAAAQGEVVPEADELRSLLQGFGTENSAERFALMDRFGPQAFANIAAVDNPYIQNPEKDATLSRYSTIYKLQVILQDPEATEEEKAKAQVLLERFGG